MRVDYLRHMKCDGYRLPTAHVSFLFDLLHAMRSVTLHRVGILALLKNFSGSDLARQILEHLENRKEPNGLSLEGTSAFAALAASGQGFVATSLALSAAATGYRPYRAALHARSQCRDGRACC
jgi:GNAT superfamily N-acetyltransferase